MREEDQLRENTVRAVHRASECRFHEMEEVHRLHELCAQSRERAIYSSNDAEKLRNRLDKVNVDLKN